MSIDSAALFAEAVSIMARLRGPGGCAWDREQTFDTIRKYTLEESYEVFDAIEPDLTIQGLAMMWERAQG